MQENIDLLNKQKKIHIIGIAGVGSSAIAIMLQKLGHIVSGSDEGFYEPTTSYLKDHKIDIKSPYLKENIPHDVDLIIMGRHAKLNEKDNVEVNAALLTKDKIRSFPQVLSEITKNRQNIVVAGSYGKSTCAAMMAWCLLQAGKKPGYFFGAIPIGFSENADMGEGEYFILEGDEYPAWEGVSKFLYLHPSHVLLTSAEHDHVNVFPTEESYIKPYRELINLLPEDGLLVAGINNPNVKSIASPHKNTKTYGISGEVSWSAKNIKYGVLTKFDLHKDGIKITELSTSLLGEHNIENMVGVAAFLIEINVVSIEEIQKGISSFKGLKRRLELKSQNSSVLVYEGFGSSYKKAETVFQAIKLHFPNKRIVTIFEPHTFSWRNKDNLDWYKNIFNRSDETIIFRPPTHGEESHNQASLEEIMEVVRINSPYAYSVENKDEAMQIIEKTLQPQDVIILMSSGDLGGLITEVPRWAEQKFPI